MWIMTPLGFFSAVEKRGDREANMLTIRARSIADLEALVETYSLPTKVTKGGGTDYPCRITIERAKWAGIVADMALEVNYSNFKDAVKARQGAARASVYSRVWSALLSIEGKRERKAGFGSYAYPGFSAAQSLPTRPRNKADRCPACDGWGESLSGAECRNCLGSGKRVAR